MDDIWTLVRFGHLLGVILWVGGIILMGAVIVPVARGLNDVATSRDIITTAARRFAVVGGIAWVLLLVTGFGLLDHRNIKVSELTDTEYGTRILVKLILLVLMGIVAAVHSAWQGPAKRRAETVGDEATVKRLRIARIASDSFLLLGSLAALWLAVSLIP